VIIVLAQDRVANIRMNVSKSMQALLPLLAQQPQANQDIIDQFQQILNQLCNDPDHDVSYFANQARRSGQ